MAKKALRNDFAIYEYIDVFGFVIILFTIPH